MTKFFKNLFRLILIKTPWFIILNYIKNFLPNYKTKNKSKIIEDQIYKNVVPPISLLNEKDKKQLIADLGKLDFTLESLKIA